MFIFEYMKETKSKPFFRHLEDATRAFCQSKTKLSSSLIAQSIPFVHFSVKCNGNLAVIEKTINYGKPIVDTMFSKTSPKITQHLNNN